jgi:putative Holliday junction resolvase
MEGRVLGIDFGVRRIGIAISDPSGIIAQGLDTIEYEGLDEAFKILGGILDRFEVAEAVIGLPLTLKGKSGESVNRVMKFGESLKSRFDVQVSYLDERFTSVMAERSLKEMGQSPSRVKGSIDRIAATILLQDHLNRQAQITDSCSSI